MTEHDPRHRERVRRTATQMRWAVRGVLALAVILAVAWLLLVRR